MVRQRRAGPAAAATVTISPRLEVRMERDEDAIRAVVATWHRATAAGDVDAVLALMTEDATFLGAGRPPMHSRAAFEQALRMLLDDAPDRIERHGARGARVGRPRLRVDRPHGAHRPVRRRRGDACAPGARCRSSCAGRTAAGGWRATRHARRLMRGAVRSHATAARPAGARSWASYIAANTVVQYVPRCFFFFFFCYTFSVLLPSTVNRLARARDPAAPQRFAARR